MNMIGKSIKFEDWKGETRMGRVTNILDNGDFEVATDSGMALVKNDEIIKMRRGGGVPKAVQMKRNKVGKVMGEFKRGKLHSGSKRGPIVTDRDQAIAIALSEAGMSKKMAKGGNVTQSELNKGYQFTYDLDEDNSGSIYKEYGVYFVKGFENGKHFSEAFEKFADAKKYYIEKSSKKMARGGKIKVGDKVTLPEIKMPNGSIQFEKVENGEVLYIKEGIYGVKNPKTNRIHQVRLDQIQMAKGGSMYADGGGVDMNKKILSYLKSMQTSEAKKILDKYDKAREEQGSYGQRPAIHVFTIDNILFDGKKYSARVQQTYTYPNFIRIYGEMPTIWELDLRNEGHKGDIASFVFTKDKWNEVSKKLQSSMYADGGMVDLFEDYENIPENIQSILDDYSEDFEDGNYSGIQTALKEVEANGYTFEYGLDGEAYGLRPIGVKLNELEGYEDEEDSDEMAKGGSAKKMIKTYKLRAEGLNDFLAFLQNGMYFRVKSFTVQPIGVPDVVVSFETDASLSEIKSKLKEIPDSHVMLQTVKPINEYTGDRDESEGYARGGGVKSIKYKTDNQIFANDLTKYADLQGLKSSINKVGNYYVVTTNGAIESKESMTKKLKDLVESKMSKGGQMGWKHKMAKGGLTGNQRKLDVNKNGRIDSEDLARLRGEMSNGGSMYADGGKLFSINPHSIGKAKYVIDFYDGKSTHKDGSPFVGIKTFSSKEKLMQEVKNMKSDGYSEVSNVSNALSMNKKSSSKNYYVQYNVGKVKYLVNYHDGVKKHKDGSDFYDIATFNNKKDLEEFITKLSKQGYKTRMAKGGSSGWKHKMK